MTTNVNKYKLNLVLNLKDRSIFDLNDPVSYAGGSWKDPPWLTERSHYARSPRPVDHSTREGAKDLVKNNPTQKWRPPTPHTRR